MLILHSMIPERQTIHRERSEWKRMKWKKQERIEGESLTLKVDKN